MKKLISMILSVLIVLGMTTSAYAKETQVSDIEYEISTQESADGASLIQTIIISGKNADPNKLVSLRILHDGKAISDYTGSNALDVFAVLKQTVADESGNFEFRFPFSEPIATQIPDGVTPAVPCYRADINYKGSSIATIGIETSDIAPFNEFLTKINRGTGIDAISVNLNANDKSDFDTVVNNSNHYDGAKISVYNDLSDANKVLVLKEMLADFKAIVDDGDAATKNTTTTVREALDKYTAIKIFNQTNDAVILKKAYDLYSDSLYNNLFDLSSSPGIEALYGEFDDTEKDAVLTAVGGKTYNDIQSIIDALKETIFLKAIKGTTYSTDVATIIDNNMAYLDFTTDAELAAKNSYNNNDAVKSFVCDMINTLKSTISNKDGFKEEFVKAVGAYVPPSQSGSTGNGGYSGGGGSSSISVGSSLVETTAPVATMPTYSDMSGHWAMDAVSYLTGLRIVSGRGDNTFDPESPVTRAEYVKMIVEAYGLYNGRATADFVDVTPDQWHYKYIASMVEKGYLLGDATGAFNPDALISRQDMAVILYRVLQGSFKVELINTLELVFDDFDDVSPYAQNSVAYLSNMKLINGSEGMFRPHANSTRAEAAQIVFNALMEVDK